MADNNDFGILLVAELEEVASIANINKKLEEIALKINTLKITLDVDDKGITGITSKIEKAFQESSNVVSNASKQATQAINSQTDSAKKLNTELGRATEMVGKVTRYKLENGRKVYDGETIKFRDTNGIERLVKYNKERQAVYETEVNEIGKLKDKEQRIVDMIDGKVEKSAIIRRAREKKAVEVHANAINKVIQSQGDAELKARDEVARAIEQTIAKREQEAKKDAELQNKFASKSAENNMFANQREKLRVNKLGDKIGVVDSFDKDSALKAIKDFYGQMGEVEVKSFEPFYQGEKQLYKFTAAIKTGKDTFKTYKGSIDETTKSLFQNKEGAEKTLNRNLGFFEQLKIAIARVPLWMAAMTLFYGTLRQVQQGIKDVIDVDSALVNLRKVTDESKESYKQFALEANKMGQELGKTSVDVIKSTAEFARLGYTLDQAKTLSKNALLFSNVGDIGAEEASKNLISTIKGFGVEVDREGRNITKIVDVYNEVGNHFAITSAGIGEALTRSAASLHEAGNTLEESVAMITAANSVIQDPAQVGTALKTIALRLRGISEEGEIVKDLVPTLESSFNKLGLTLKKDDNTFKSTFEMMRDLAGIWGRLNDFQKADILEKVAGKRQANIVAAMISNWKDAEKAFTTAENSFGSAAEENAKALDSVEAKMNQFANATIGFWQTVVNSDGIKGFFDALTKLANAVTGFVSTFGMLGPVIAIASIALLVFNKGPLQALNGSLLTSFVNLTGVGQGLLKVAVTSGVASVAVDSAGVSLGFAGFMAKGFGIALNGARTAALGLVTVLPQMLILSAIGYAISFVIDKVKEYRDEQVKLENELSKTTETFTKNKNEIDRLVDRYDELSNKRKNVNLNNDEQKELIDIQDKLSKLLPDVTDKYDEQGHAILKTALAVKELKKNLEELTQIQNDKTILDLGKSFTEAEDKIKKAQEKLAMAEREGQNKDKYTTSTSLIPGDSATGYTEKKNAKDQVEDQLKIALAKKELRDAQEGLNKVYGQYNELTNYGKKEVTLITEADKKYLGVSRDLQEAQAKKNNGEVKNLEIAKNIASQETAIGIARQELSKELNDINGNNYEERAARVSAALKYQGVSQSYINELLAEYNKKLHEVADLSGVFGDIGKSLYSSTNTFVEGQKELAQTIDNINKGEKVSTETILKLVETHKLENAMYVDQNGILRLNADLLAKSAKAKQAEHKIEMEQLKQKAIAEKDRLEATAKRMLAELNMQGKINDLKDAELDRMIRMTRMEQKSEGRTNPEYAAQLDREIEQLKSLKLLKSEYNTAIAEVARIAKEADILGSVDWNAMLASDDNKKGKNPADQPEPLTLTNYDWLDNQQEALIQKAKAKMETLDKLSKEYADEQMKIVKALQERQRLSKIEEARLTQEAQALLPRIDAETDISKRNELIRKYQEWMSKAQTLSKEWWSWQKDINDITIVPNDEKFKVDQFAASIEKIDNKIKEQKSLREDLKKSSQEYRVSIVQEMEAVNEKNSVIQDEINKTEELIKSTKAQLEVDGLTEKQKNELLKKADEYEKKLRELIGTQADLKKETKSLNNELKDSRKAWEDEANAVADKIIEAIKNYYKKKKELALDAIDKEQKAEDERHKKKMDELDDEYKAQEKAINAKLKAIDEESAMQDFNKELTKEQTDRAEIQAQIDKLSMDDSIEAQAKLAELKKKLAEKDDKIKDMQDKRERDLRKGSLKDQLDSKKDEIDGKKKIEDDYHDQQKKKLDADKEYWTKFYDDQINNEHRWADIRKQVLEGNIEELKRQLSGYIDEFDKLVQESMTNAGGFINENLSLIEQLKKALADVGGIDYSNKPADGSDTGNGGQAGDGQSGNQDEKDKNTAHDKYIKNKVKWIEEYYRTGGNTDSDIQKALKIENDALRTKYNFKDYNQNDLIAMGAEGLDGFITAFREYIDNKLKWGTSDAETQKKLQERNNQLRSKYLFPDWTVDDIKRLRLDKFDTGGYTGNWTGNEGRVAMLHKKEIVLDPSDTKNILKAVDILRNRPINIPPVVQSSNAENRPTTIIENIELIIERLSGDEKGGKTVYNVLIDELKKRGV